MIKIDANNDNKCTTCNQSKLTFTDIGDSLHIENCTIIRNLLGSL